MFMAPGKAMKAYIGRRRISWATTKPMITNVRFAQGGRGQREIRGPGDEPSRRIRQTIAKEV
jgi:hypothetical protein